jgi:hypothetical protein
LSGLADIFFVTAALLVGTLYAPFMLEAALLNHMGPCELPKQKKKELPLIRETLDMPSVV